MGDEVQLNFEIDEETARRSRVIKSYLDITWPEYIREANQCLSEKHDLDLD